jgi:hypothetical protein
MTFNQLWIPHQTPHPNLHHTLLTCHLATEHNLKAGRDKLIKTSKSQIYAINNNENPETTPVKVT